MTSQLIRAKLHAAIELIAKCERVFEDPERAARRGYDLDALYAVQDFMAAHREELRAGGEA